MDDTNNELFSLSAEEQAEFDGQKDDAAPVTAEEPAQPEAEPEAPQPEEDGEGEPEKPQKDPKWAEKALAAERAKARQLKQERAQWMEERARLQGRFEILERLARGEQAPQPLDPDANPIEVIKAQGQTIEQLQKAEQERQQQLEYQAQHQRFIASYQAQASEFATANQDFPDAYNHLLQSRGREYQALGYSPDEVVNILRSEEEAIVTKAFHDGVNPAERLYELAKMRGYSKAQPKVNTEEERIRTMNKAEAASKSLSARPGGTVSSTPTIDALLKMSDDEFAAATKGRKFEELASSLNR